MKNGEKTAENKRRHKENNQRRQRQNGDMETVVEKKRHNILWRNQFEWCTCAAECTPTHGLRKWLATTSSTRRLVSIRKRRQTEGKTCSKN